MKQAHIQLDESVNAKYAILPGDPARLDIGDKMIMFKLE